MSAKMQYLKMGRSHQALRRYEGRIPAHEDSPERTLRFLCRVRPIDPRCARGTERHVLSGTGGHAAGLMTQVSQVVEAGDHVVHLGGISPASTAERFEVGLKTRQGIGFLWNASGLE